eukprot:TRINITY_DN12696_c0_g1_i2.p1 TRINITY_DN12696_c0_g1~~TRINITY_DN12696_c0_g1_i2.p1  ORF type:complete len:311 (-),score=36.62 TRINITY_DN12696_c0_g1_i2:69-974(-)
MPPSDAMAMKIPEYVPDDSYAKLLLSSVKQQKLSAFEWPMPNDAAPLPTVEPPCILEKAQPAIAEPVPNAAPRGGKPKLNSSIEEGPQISHVLRRAAENCPQSCSRAVFLRALEVFEVFPLTANQAATLVQDITRQLPAEKTQDLPASSLAKKPAETRLTERRPAAESQPNLQRRWYQLRTCMRVLEKTYGLTRATPALAANWAECWAACLQELDLLERENTVPSYRRQPIDRAQALVDLYVAGSGVPPSLTLGDVIASERRALSNYPANTTVGYEQFASRHPVTHQWNSSAVATQCDGPI